jgi:hypothetical protein
MKSLTKLLLFLAPLTVLAGQREPVETAPLDDRVVYVVPVATNRVTTVSFPGPIIAIDAANVTTDPRVPGQFQLAHTKGTAFFSVRAVASGASANVNVRWAGNTYVFQLEENPVAVYSLILEDKPGGGAVRPAPVLSPARLLALLDKAKTFPLLKTQHPEAVMNVDFATFEKRPQITDCGDYEIRIVEAYRFNTEDTLVFRLAMKNRLDEPIHYRPDSLALRVGNRIYHQSISDATGLMPPMSDLTAYFAITGTPDGGRNEISLENDFAVLISRIPATPEPGDTNQLPVAP